MNDMVMKVMKEGEGLVGVWQQWVIRNDSGNLVRLSRKNAFEQVLPYLKSGGNPEDRRYAEDVALLVGECFGIHREHKDNVGNFGRSMGRMKDMMLAQGAESGVDRRANRIIQSKTVKSLAVALPHMVRWMSGKGIPIDFVLLYHDVYQWDDHYRRGWARTYYMGMETDEKGE